MGVILEFKPHRKGSRVAAIHYETCTTTLLREKGDEPGLGQLPGCGNDAYRWSSCMSAHIIKLVRLAARATFRLHQLVSGSGLEFERVDCVCRAGTEGT